MGPFFQNLGLWAIYISFCLLPIVFPLFGFRPVFHSIAQGYLTFKAAFALQGSLLPNHLGIFGVSWRSPLLKLIWAFLAAGLARSNKLWLGCFYSGGTRSAQNSKCGSIQASAAWFPTSSLWRGNVLRSARSSLKLFFRSSLKWSSWTSECWEVHAGLTCGNKMPILKHPNYGACEWLTALNIRNPEKGAFAKGALRKFLANCARNSRKIVGPSFRGALEEGCAKLS